MQLNIPNSIPQDIPTLQSSGKMPHTCLLQAGGGHGMNENEIGTIIVNTAVDLHKKLETGLLESVYETILSKHL